MNTHSATGSPVWLVKGGGRLASAPFLVAGILNLTPDSFSDGGAYADVKSAVDRAMSMLAEGAHMIDLGAESTRPGSSEVGEEEEVSRLVPTLLRLVEIRDARMRAAKKSEPGAPVPFALSVDTWRAATASESLKHGADVINDISGGLFDGGMIEVLAEYKPGYVLGHSPAKPKTMQAGPVYDDVVDAVMSWFCARMDALVKAGLPENRIALDPCIGFAKKLEHNLALMRAVPRLLTLGRPLCFGISRKSFLGDLTGLPAGMRDPATQVCTALLASMGVAVHRVHDVAGAVNALRLVEALVG